MPVPEYNPETLYKVELAFAKAHDLSITALDKIRDLRLRQGKDLPTPLHRIASWVVAPVLAAYAGWLVQQAKSHKNPRMLGVMREGRTLCRLVHALSGIDAEEIWLNRNLSLLAAFGCGDDEALVNWLVRTRLQPITREEAARHLFGTNHTSPDGSEIISVENVYDLLEQWKSSGKLDVARMRASVIADRLLMHWRNVAGTADFPVLLMDFACAGNIQRSLQTIFAAKGIKDSVIGLNFVMTEGSRWAEKAGCVMRGYLAERGKPEWFANAYARTPELIEIFAAPPLGPIKFYADNGAVVCNTNFLDPARQKLLNSVQDLIVEQAILYHRGLSDNLSGDFIRCLWGRILLEPLEAEIEALANWPLDAGLDGTENRVLAAFMRDAPEPWTKMQTAWPAASRKHRLAGY